MNTAVITFDTHALIKKLEATGFQREQAEGISEALKDVMSVAELATNRDIERVENRIDRLKLEIQAELASVKADLSFMKWGICACIVGILIPIVRNLF